MPLDEVVELHSSSGTTGKPIGVGYNESDMAMWADCIMRLVQMAVVVPGDRAQMAFGYGMFTGGFGLHYGLQKLGLHDDPRRLRQHRGAHIAMIEDYGTTVLVATPSYALHVCEGGGEDGLRLGESPRCAWACSAASRARRASRPRSRIACTSCAPTTTA